MSTIAQQRANGVAIAEMYIAAQHVDMEASNIACEAMENATLAMKIGFNQRMADSPYNVRAE